MLRGSSKWKRDFKLGLCPTNAIAGQLRFYSETTTMKEIVRDQHKTAVLKR